MLMPNMFAVGSTIKVKPARQAGRVLGRLPGGAPYSRSQPVISGPQPLWMIEDRKRRELETVVFPDCEVVELTNAIVLYGLVFAQDGTLIEESLINRRHEPHVMGLSRTDTPDQFVVSTAIPQVGAVSEGTYVMMAQLFDGNYGHWLTDCLPKMVAIQDCVDERDATYLVSGHPSVAVMQLYASTLAWYGVSRDKLKPIGAEPKSFEKLIYATPLTNEAWVKAPLAICTLENLGNRIGNDPDAPSKIMVRRPENQRRRLLNINDISDCARQFGYVEVCPADLTFEQQVLAFSNARQVIGVLGADCTNIVFAARGIQFLGLAPAEMHDDFFWDLVSHKRGTYHCLHGPCLDHPGSMNSDFTVDLQQFALMAQYLERQ